MQKFMSKSFVSVSDPDRRLWIPIWICRRRSIRFWICNTASKTYRLLLPQKMMQDFRKIGEYLRFYGTVNPDLF